MHPAQWTQLLKSYIYPPIDSPCHLAWYLDVDAGKRLLSMQANDSLFLQPHACLQKPQELGGSWHFNNDLNSLHSNNRWLLQRAWRVHLSQWICWEFLWSWWDLKIVANQKKNHHVRLLLIQTFFHVRGAHPVKMAATVLTMAVVATPVRVFLATMVQTVRVRLMNVWPILVKTKELVL